MSKPGIMIALGKVKGPSMPPPTFGGKSDRLPAPSPAADEQPDDEVAEADGMKRIEDKLDEILLILKNDSGGEPDGQDESQGTGEAS